MPSADQHPFPTCIFVPSLRGGGAERMTVNLASGLARLGLPITLVVANADGPFASAVPDTVPLGDLKSRTVLTSLSPLTRYLKRSQPAVFLAIMDHAGVIALWAKRLAGTKTKIVVSSRGTLSYSGQSPDWIGDRIMPHLIHWSYPLADHIIAVSRGVADDLASTARLPRNRIRVIYNPVVTPALLEMSREFTGHPWLDDPTLPVILSVGRLTRAKDLPTLLTAFALLRKKTGARLILLGEGEERNRIDYLARELGIRSDMELLGFKRNPYAFMARSALVALSSVSEGLPSVLIEALACGTPVVSTDCASGPAEILENGRYGPLVPVRNPRALADAMMHELKEPHASALLRKRADDFSLDRALQEYQEVLYA